MKNKLRENTCVFGISTNKINKHRKQIQKKFKNCIFITK